MSTKAFALWKQIYGATAARLLKEKLQQLNFDTKAPQLAPVSSRTAILCAYPDTFVGKPQTPTLKLLHRFTSAASMRKNFPVLHILPLHPWDQDRGFSIVDYLRVCPRYGTWREVSVLSKHHEIMLDFVLNHASFRNPLIQKALCASITGKPSRAKELVITFSQRPSAKELRTVARPRFTPLLTPYSVYQKRRKIFAVLGSPPPRSHVLGRGWVWTTFSRPPHPNGTTATTQVDFNFSSPHTFAALLPALRKLLESGAGWLRFDAVGYLWKAPGCTSLHEPETFKLLEAWRAVTHYWRPGARLVAEVNEPQDTLLRYLGTPSNPRADFVYQFAAFPLAVHAIQRGHVLYFRRWLKSLSRFRGRQIVTVLGTHDGMSLKPLARWLPAREQQWLLNLLRRNHQAQPNFARLPGGKKIAYEICGTPWNLINPPRSTARTPLALPRYLAVLHLGLLVRGIPCLYANGLWGSPHYQPRGGLDENRTINRQRFPYSSFLRAWQNPRHHFGQVGREVLRLFSLRQQLPHFHPFAPPPQILPAPPSVLAALLPPPRKGKALLTLINVTKKTTEVKIKLPSPILRDVIHGEKFTSPTRHASIPLKPYQARWLISA